MSVADGQSVSKSWKYQMRTGIETGATVWETSKGAIGNSLSSCRQLRPSIPLSVELYQSGWHATDP
jgi:hypothetical protein